ncbi:phospholipase D family protein [Natronospora cellulosivora (SeqCode)]
MKLTFTVVDIEIVETLETRYDLLNWSKKDLNSYKSKYALGLVSVLPEYEVKNKKKGEKMNHNKYYWHGDDVLSKELNVKKIKNIFIASAFFSNYGLELLKKIINNNSLSKENVIIYLSPEFSNDNPGKLLKKLYEIAKVYIVYNIPFHPKVYLIEQEEDTKVMFGSSNFTNGGFNKNIEFNVINNKCSKKEIDKLQLFFKFCNNNSKLVNQEIIDIYIQQHKELKKLKQIQQSIRENLHKFESLEDPFKKNTYNISSYFFSYSDYETFFKKNQQRSDINIMKKREHVEEKLRKVHKIIYDDVKKINLNCHWRDKNITSSLRPNRFNKGKVSWLGIRYGKSKKELDYLNMGAEANEELGFQKHACLLFSIYSLGVEISLFHSVIHDAFDRGYIQDQLKKDSYRKKLIKEIEKLKGEKFIWHLKNKDSNESYEFHIDNESAKDFVAFYLNNDKDGLASFMSYFIDPDSDELKDINAFTQTIINKFKKMIYIYRLVAFRC